MYTAISLKQFVGFLGYVYISQPKVINRMGFGRNGYTKIDLLDQTLLTDNTKQNKFIFIGRICRHFIEQWVPLIVTTVMLTTHTE